MIALKFVYHIEENTIVYNFLEKMNYSSKLIIKLKKKGIIINGEPARCDSLLNKGDILEVLIPEEESNIPSVDKPIEILFEDDYLMALYKPHGLAVMGTRAHYDDNLSSYVMNYFHKSGLKSTVHLINRLDKDTAGIVLIAKSSYIHHLFQRIKLEKRYYALVHGRPLGNIIDEPIKRSEGIKRIVDKEGKQSITKYQVLETINDKSLVDINLVTGRTHQIRVHFSFIGHPLVGDSLYGIDAGELKLEAYYLAFTHPISQEKIIIEKSKDFKGGKINE